jgi:hypothetical protein
LDKLDLPVLVELLVKQEQQEIQVQQAQLDLPDLLGQLAKPVQPVGQDQLVQLV